LTELVQKPQKYCGCWLLTQFTDAFFDKLFRANLVASAQMRLVEHAIVRDVVANHRLVVSLADSGLLADPILSCVVAIDIMSPPFPLFTECLVVVFIDTEVGMVEIWR
jgi:hypothetical protein